MKRALRTALIGTLLSTACSVQAQVTPGGSDAPRMDAAANGTKIVTINAPNSRGVSSNTYTDFNVGAGGLILNNSSKITQTKLAGYIDGNANLKASGPASTILNQVTSNNPTTLAGYLEVAGTAAQVIVANSAGITCNGCGFINAPWATLTTGTANRGVDGAITGFQVGRGTITVGGQGLDASGMRLDLFARAVVVNAGIWADTVNVGAGAADVATGSVNDDIIVTARKADATEPAPRFAIDVAALGGMYARSIRLIGTEAGLGVNVDGTLASLEKGFTLTSAGNIQIAGKAVATTTATLQSTGGTSVSGTVYGGQSVGLVSGGTLTSSGLIASNTDLTISSNGLVSSGTIAAGLNQDGTLAAAGNVAISSAGPVSMTGQTVLAGGLDITAPSLDLGSGSVQASTAMLNASSVSQATKGQFVTTGGLSIVAGSFTNAGVVQGGGVNLAGGSVTNNGGRIAALGALSAGLSGALSNANGTIQSVGATKISASGVANAGGSIANVSTAATSITTTGAIASPGGTIGGNGDVAITAASFDFTGVGALAKPGTAGGNGQLSAGGTLSAQATAGGIVVDGGGLISAGKDVTLVATGPIHAIGGNLSAGSLATLRSPSIVFDTGSLQAGVFDFGAGSLSLRGSQVFQTGTADFDLTTTGTLDYSGAAFTSNATNFMVSAGSIVNEGGVLRHAGAGVFSISAGSIDNRNGTLATAGTLALDTGSLDNGGGLISAAGDAGIVISGRLRNETGGLVDAAGKPVAGSIVANGALSLRSGDIANAGGDIEAAGPVSVKAASLTGIGGQLKSTGNGTSLTLVATGAVEARGGRIGSNGATTITAASIDVGGNGQLTGGSIAATAASGSIAAVGGIVQGGTGTGTGFVPGAVSLTAATAIDVSGGGAINGGAVSLTASVLVSGNGGLVSAQGLTAKLGGIANAGGTIVATQKTPLVLTVAGTIDNNGGGLIETDAADLTLAAAQIGNQGGTILHAGTGTLTLSDAGLLDNTGGTIRTGGRFAVSAASLANDGHGVLTAAGSSTISLAGSLSNLAGLIAADQSLAINAGAITNSGTIGSSLGSVTLISSGLNNRGGTIEGGTGAGGAVTIDIGAGAFDNGAKGLVGSSGPLLLNAGTLTNAAGIIHSDANATLTLAALTNGGEISATRGLVLSSVNAVDNTGGLIAGGDLTLTAGSFVNHNGLVSGSNSATIRTTGLLDNTAGGIGSGGQLSLGTGNMINGGTIASASTSGGNAGSNIAISTTGQVTNLTGGAIWADHDLAFMAAGLVNAGSIGSGNDAAVTAGSIDNAAATGVIGAGNRLSIAFVSGTLGRLAAGNDLALTATGDWTVATGQSLTAPHDLTLDSSGSITNLGTIGAGHAATLIAGGNVSNQSGGTISGDQLTLTAAGLINAGLINAGGSAVIAAGTVTNTGQIFGDAIRITAQGDVVNSGTAGVIATRSGTLAIFTPGTVTNADSALLHSNAGLVIAGHDLDANGNWGAASSLTNTSATIEAQGDGLLSANAITNTRTTFTAASVVTSATYVSLAPVYSDSEHRSSERYTETISDTQVTGDSGAGQILFGGNLLINAGIVDNLHSTLSAVGNLTVNASSLSNIALAKTETEDDNGINYNEAYVCTERFIFCFSHDWRDQDNSPLNREYVNQLGTLVPSVIAAGGNLTINAGLNNLLLDAAGGTVSASATLAGATTSPGGNTTLAYSTATGGGTITATRVGAGAQSAISASPTSGAFGAVIKGVSLLTGTNTAVGAVNAVTPAGMTALGQLIGVPATTTAAFHIGLGGLFSFAPVGSHYLIETNPAFTNQGNFVSSDYFLARLGYDPTVVEQRLGDALYEQQLVSQQLTSLTGTSRLAAYADNDSEFRALLDAGATYAKQFDLALGVGLSAGQMAALTGDIVVLVDETVQSPSGPQHALVPIVYLTATHGSDLQNAGASITSGGALTIRSNGGLANTGVIRSAAGASVSTAGTLVNGGAIASSGPLSVSTGGDLISNGGRFSGSDVTLAAGGNMQLGATAATTHSVTAYAGGGVKTDATVNTGTAVIATGKLAVVTQGNLVAQGAQLTAGDTAELLVGGSANLGAVNDSSSSLSWHAISHGGTSTATVDETARGTGIAGTNGVTVAAGLIDPGGTLAVTGGKIGSANGAVALSGTNGVLVGAANELHTSNTGAYTVSSGFLSYKTTSATDNVTSNAAVGSTVSGSTVQIGSANGGIAVNGSNVVADADVSLLAKGPVTIGTAQTSTLETTSSAIHKSGFSIGSGGLSLGDSKTSANGTANTVTNTGSLIGSSGGNVTVGSGSALTVTGSRIATPGAVALTGQSIAIQNATDTLDTTSHSHSSSFGLTIGASSPLTNEAQTVVSAGRLAGSTPDARTAAVSAIAGGLAVSNGIDAGKAILSGKGGATLSASIGFSSSSSSSAAHSETITPGSISGGNVQLAARGAGAASTISVRGSDIAATGDPTAGNGNLSLGADGAINLAAAAANDTSSGSNRSSGASLGVSIGVGTSGFGGPSVTAAFNTAHGNYAGADVTNRATTLSATGTTMIGTPGALTIDGSQVGGNRVNIDAGALSIASRQDTSTYNASNSSFGASVSVTLSGQVTGGLNVGSGKQNGTFASVADQAGIYAGDAGFGINVRDATALKGAVIASTADVTRNSLTTGSFSASDLQNSERYKASQTSLGVGLGANLGTSSGGKVNTDGSGTALPGIHTGLGTLSATPPIAMTASGSQGSTTRSAVAPGTIVLTGGDAGSASAVAGVRRDTTGANAALTQQFTDAKRTQIAQGFEASQLLTGEVGTFFSNRAADQKAAEAKAIAAGVVHSADGTPLRDGNGNLIALRPDAQTYIDEAATLQQRYGAGSSGRIIATALSGAAGSNVTGGLTGLVQSTAANVLESLATSQVKRIADSVSGGTAAQEAVRTALQAVVGCAGQAAGGGNCGSAATGAAASVVTNYLLTSYLDPKPALGTSRTLEDQQARSDLVATITGAIAVGAGLDAGAAVTSARIETQNNDLLLPNGHVAPGCKPGQPCANSQTFAQFLSTPDGKAAKIEAVGSLRSVNAALAANDDAVNGVLEIGLVGGLVTDPKEALNQAVADYTKFYNLNRNASPDQIYYAVQQISQASASDVVWAGGVTALETYLLSRPGASLATLRTDQPNQGAILSVIDAATLNPSSLVSCAGATSIAACAGTLPSTSQLFTKIDPYVTQGINTAAGTSTPVTALNGLGGLLTNQGYTTAGAVLTHDAAIAQGVGQGGLGFVYDAGKGIAVLRTQPAQTTVTALAAADLYVEKYQLGQATVFNSASNWLSSIGDRITTLVDVNAGYVDTVDAGESLTKTAINGALIVVPIAKGLTSLGAVADLGSVASTATGTATVGVEVGVADAGAATKLGDTAAFHATRSTEAAQSILANGIDPAYLNSDSRFGAAFYVAEQPETALAEMAHYGVDPATGIRFSVNLSQSEILDLSDPATANLWGYKGGPITPATQSIGRQAIADGYKAIRYPSERAAGSNIAVLQDFNNVLKPVMVTPISK